MAMILIISFLCAFLLFLLLILLLGAVMKRKKAVSERMHQYVGDFAEEEEDETPSARRRLRLAFRKQMRKMGSQKTASKLDLMMHRAGLPLLGYEMVAISIVGALLAGFLAMIFLGSFLYAILVGVITFMAAWGWVKIRIAQRLQAFLYQMADCLTLIANSLRAGFSFLQTVELISKEMKPPVSSEFARVLRETNLGKPMDQALTEMDQRVGSPDFSLIVTAVLIQQQVGGNLADIIDVIRDTILERIRIRREIHTLTAQGRASGIILALLPVAMGLFMYITSPEYMRPLLTTRIGQMIIAGAVFLEIVGFLIIRKIVDIKV